MSYQLYISHLEISFHLNELYSITINQVIAVSGISRQGLLITNVMPTSLVAPQHASHVVALWLHHLASHDRSMCRHGRPISRLSLALGAGGRDDVPSARHHTRIRHPHGHWPPPRVLFGLRRTLDHTTTPRAGSGLLERRHAGGSLSYNGEPHCKDCTRCCQ